MSEEAGAERGRVLAIVLSFLKRSCRRVWTQLSSPPRVRLLLRLPSMSFPAAFTTSFCSGQSRLPCSVPRGYLFNIVTRQQRKKKRREDSERSLVSWWPGRERSIHPLPCGDDVNW